MTKCTPLPPPSDQKWGWFTFHNETKEEIGKEKEKRQWTDPRSLQVCVSHQKTFPHCIPLPCNGLVPVQQGPTPRQPAFFQELPVLCCSLASLGTSKTKLVLLSSHEGFLEAPLGGRKSSSSAILTTSGSICPPVHGSCSTLRGTNVAAGNLLNYLSKAEGN